MFRGNTGSLLTSTGVTMPAYDNFAMALSAGDTTETWTFKKGSTSVAVWILVYTDDTRSTISTGTFRDLST